MTSNRKKTMNNKQEKTMNTKTIVIGVAVAAALGALAYSQLQSGGSDSMQGMNHSTTATADAPASTQAYETAMAEMMKAMMAPLAGKADLDFMQGMIPHHQGAIDMSKAVLQYGNEITAFAAGAAVYVPIVEDITGEPASEPLSTLVVGNAAAAFRRHPEAALRFRELLRLATP